MNFYYIGDNAKGTLPRGLLQPAGLLRLGIPWTGVRQLIVGQGRRRAGSGRAASWGQSLPTERSIVVSLNT